MNARAALSMTIALGCATGTPAAGLPTAASSPAPALAALEHREPKPETHGNEPRASGAPAVLIQSPICPAVDWSPRSPVPLLVRGKGRKSPFPDRAGVHQELFAAECTDAPAGASLHASAPEILDGVQIRVSRVTAAGVSGRDWAGNQCEFEVSLADGSGVPVVLGEAQVPPFNTISAVVRSGSAAWLSIGFNGYAREFPKGGNRIVAVDLCQGRVVWQSKDGISNGGLLMLDDYLVTPYGFTSERRFVFVLDAYSGNVIQKLPVIENVCPSKRWAPNWSPGERCDRPGQFVGAATEPRIEDGTFLVDTNTGSSRFEFN